MNSVDFVGETMPMVSHKNPDFSKVYINEIDELRKKLNASQSLLRKMKNLKSLKRKNYLKIFGHFSGPFCIFTSLFHLILITHFSIEN